MRIKTIKKKNGKLRLIYSPSAAEKKALRELLLVCERAAHKACLPGVVHGFVPARNAVTNAQCHVGYEFTTCFDLADFFDSVRPSHVAGMLPEDVERQVFVDGAPRQGLPTSPAVANLAAAALDRSIMKWISTRGIVYTRYADDLSFSYHDPALTGILCHKIPALVRQHGFAVNDAKTRTMNARHGRRTITGIAVGEDGIHPTRRAKRKLRAARHQENQRQAAGLAEWCRVKTPRAWRVGVANATAILEWLRKPNQRGDALFIEQARQAYALAVELGARSVADDIASLLAPLIAVQEDDKVFRGVL